MKPQIPWLRVSVEGVVIVGSILLAFGIQAWWDGRQESQLERQVLTTLLEELGLIESGLDRLEQGGHRAIGEASHYLLEAIARPQGRSADSIARAVHQIDGTTVVSLDLASYELLVSSGTLGILSDPELAQRLWTLDSILERLGRLESLERAFLDGQMHPYYNAHVDRGRETSPFLDRQETQMRGRVRRRLQWYDDRGIEPTAFREFPIDYSDLLDDPEFSNLVHSRLDLMISVQAAHQELRGAVRAVRDGALETLAL